MGFVLHAETNRSTSPSLSMSRVLNPITDERVLLVDGSLHPERRLQSILHVWLKFYFSGQEFQARAEGGGTKGYTFDQCSIEMQEAERADGAEQADGSRPVQTLPVIHGVFPDVQRRSYRSGDQVRAEDLAVTLNFMVKVSKNLSATGQAQTNPEYLCRRIADNLAWLLNSSERAALSVLGIHNLRVRSGPVVMPGSVWFMRMLTVSLVMRVRVASS